MAKPEVEHVFLTEQERAFLAYLHECDRLGRNPNINDVGLDAVTAGEIVRVLMWCDLVEITERETVRVAKPQPTRGGRR